MRALLYYMHVLSRVRIATVWLVCTVYASIQVWLRSGNVFVDGFQGSHTYSFIQCMCTYIREHTSTHIHIQVQHICMRYATTCTHVQHSIHTHTHTHRCTHARTQARIHMLAAHTHTHTHAHTHTHTRKHTPHTHTHTQTHTHTHTHRQREYTSCNARTTQCTHTGTNPYIYMHKVLKRCTLMHVLALITIHACKCVRNTHALHRCTRTLKNMAHPLLAHTCIHVHAHVSGTPHIHIHTQH